jgi:hypothetical protein
MKGMTPKVTEGMERTAVLPRLPNEGEEDMLEREEKAERPPPPLKPPTLPPDLAAIAAEGWQSACGAAA